VQVGLLFILGWLLRKKPSPAAAGVLAAGALLLAAPLPDGSLLAKAVPLFLTYALFVGFGEEIIYRGYVHSRLNEVFDRPYRFFGIPVGWGMLLSALVFGLTHSGILSFLMGWSAQMTLPWAFWTTFGGLVFSLVREKSGGILAPALLHGLPQAVAVVILLFLG
jgi:membrane protease YdiL (CAAX protease family)